MQATASPSGTSIRLSWYRCYLGTATVHRPECCKQVCDSEVTVVCSSVGFGHFSSLNLISLFGSKQNSATSIAR
jgi:hypothetical protein